MRKLVVAAVVSLWASWSVAEVPNFGRDVRPILAKHCITCHGPDENAREADLRLDTQLGSRADLGGYQAIKPGDSDDSEIIARVTSDDSDLRMPPSESHPPLSNSEIETLKAWIASGGDYETHWAFVPPQRVAVPTLAGDHWSRGPIDRFVLHRMREAGLEPAPQATREALIRRVYLDLVGITPPRIVVDRFVGNEHPLAYTRLVNELLASPAYAERFALPWLDLARYSDTNGYEKDRERTIWPYRDWVIKAITADMPFDQFSIEQLAGDMLPQATNDQRIATGFHRNTMLNEEGGIDPLEYRFHAMVDRVATTGTVWMGLTTGCAQCHTHKYDPITHTDYYSLMALMNNANEPDVLVQNEQIESTTRELHKQIDQEVERLRRQWLPATTDNEPADQNQPVETKKASIQQAFRTWLTGQREQARQWRTIRPTMLESSSPKLSVLDDGSVLASGDVTKRVVYQLKYELDAGPTNALRLEVLPHESLPAGGPGTAFYEGRRGDFFLSDLSAKLGGKTIAMRNASASFGKISIGSGTPDASNVLDGDGSTGWSTSGQEGRPNQLVVNFAQPIVDAGTLEIELLFERHFAAALGRFRVSVSGGDNPAVATSLPDEFLATDSEDNFKNLQRHFVRTADEFKPQRSRLQRLLASLPEPIRTLGFQQRRPDNPRETHRHHRGEYLQAKETVSPAVPAVFAPIQGPADRLSLARWLVSPRNPLVGRVTVNRAWRTFFGTGIVRTAGDFGTQSESPSHPELIDWLAMDWQHRGFSMKRLHRQIVLSATYQQRIESPPQSDLSNRLLSCFPHRRLDAERIRDTMLSAAGLLTRTIGGKSVYPPQPASVTAMAYGKMAWNASSGEDRYRRSLYTFAKRTAPFAAFTTFDGPSRELCIARRDSSTTPLQALTLMNDAMYMEIAEALATAAIRDCDDQAPPGEIATQMFIRLLTRTPETDELDSIVAFYQLQVGSDSSTSESAKNVSAEIKPAEHSPATKDKAIWTLVARALMNTDEAITTP